MRILLDESLPRDLSAILVSHQTTTVSAAGWSRTKNGKLLALAATRFDVVITADRNIEYQQNLITLPIAVVILVVGRTRIQAIELLVPELLRLLDQLVPLALHKVGGGSTRETGRT